MTLTIADIRKLNKEAGFRFFDRDNMKLFGSSVVSRLYENNCFITREIYPGPEVLFTVWHYDPVTHDIRILPPQSNRKSLEVARKEARECKEVL